MGFPIWTLFGMGVTVSGALIILFMAFIAQSPRLVKRLGLASARLDLRARTLTGYALALLVLAFGFFIAGVPLGPRATATEVVVATPIVDTNESGAMVAIPTRTPQAAIQATETQEQEDSAGEPVTGAFAGPPPAAQTATAEYLELAGIDAPASTSTRIAQPSATPTPTQTITPSPTPTSTATTTPTPTPTPTPIFEETAVVNTGTSTLWIKRTPGGRDIALVRGGDVVVLLPGHANVGGAIWREISKVNGTIGWVLESYLDQELEAENEAN